MKNENAVEKTVDYLIDVVGEATPSKAAEIENNLELYANDYVLSTFPNLTENDQNEIIKAAIKEYQNY